MKKKFLSLMMAAAMVATTSVSAFAANDATVSRDGEEVDVTITGSVNDQNNNAPEGTISVTIPTTLSFTVNNEGGVIGTSLDVENNGTQRVEIYAYQFVDGDGTTGINVVRPMQEGDRVNRKTSEVSLSLAGNAGTAGFVSLENKIYDAKKPTEDASGDGVKIATLGEQKTVKINLTGIAGKDKNGAVGISEKFTVRLKVKKAAN